MKKWLLFTKCNLKCIVTILVLIRHTICYRSKITTSGMTLSTWLAFLSQSLESGICLTWPKAFGSSRLKQREIRQTQILWVVIASSCSYYRNPEPPGINLGLSRPQIRLLRQCRGLGAHGLGIFPAAHSIFCPAQGWEPGWRWEAPRAQVVSAKPMCSAAKTPEEMAQPEVYQVMLYK